MKINPAANLFLIVACRLLYIVSAARDWLVENDGSGGLRGSTITRDLKKKRAPKRGKGGMKSSNKSPKSGKGQIEGSSKSPKSKGTKCVESKSSKKSKSSKRSKSSKSPKSSKGCAEPTVTPTAPSPTEMPTIPQTTIAPTATPTPAPTTPSPTTAPTADVDTPFPEPMMPTTVPTMPTAASAVCPSRQDSQDEYIACNAAAGGSANDCSVCADAYIFNEVGAVNTCTVVDPPSDGSILCDAISACAADCPCQEESLLFYQCAYLENFSCSPFDSCSLA